LVAATVGALLVAAGDRDDRPMMVHRLTSHCAGAASISVVLVVPRRPSEGYVVVLTTNNQRQRHDNSTTDHHQRDHTSIMVGVNLSSFVRRESF
jgi:hypothetical protein